MSELATVSGVELRLLVVLPAHAALEAALHEHFAPARITGEWFAITLEIQRFVEHCNRGLNPLTFIWPASGNSLATPEPVPGVA